MMQIPFKINSHPRQGLNQTEHTANANWDEKKIGQYAERERDRGEESACQK